jgi:hypothetical protein
VRSSKKYITIKNLKSRLALPIAYYVRMLFDTYFFNSLYSAAIATTLQIKIQDIYDHSKLKLKAFDADGLATLFKLILKNLYFPKEM